LARELNPGIANAAQAIKIDKEKTEMLETIIVILLVLWLVGLIAGQTFGGILHALLVIALVVFLIRLFTGRRVV
jgi:hypothetical protein